MTICENVSYNRNITITLRDFHQSDEVCSPEQTKSHKVKIYNVSVRYISMN